MHKKVPISKLRPNPFRNMSRYPIDREKVTELIASFERTGFWDNIVARENDGCYELAYGHHRLIALQEHLGKNAKVDVIIKNLDNDTMFMMMVDENGQDRANRALTEQETVRACVEAYAKGEITLDKPDMKTSDHHIRYAPSFIQGDAPRSGGEHPYTAVTIAKKLGWDAKHKVPDILTALELIEKEVLSERDFKKLGPKGAEQLTRAAKAEISTTEISAKYHEKRGDSATAEKVRKRGIDTARRKAKAFVDTYEKGDRMTIKAAQAAAAREGDPRKKVLPPQLDRWVDSLSAKINTLLTEDNAFERIEKIMPYVSSIREHEKKILIKSLDGLAQRAMKYAQKIGGQTRKLLKGGEA